jgi:hypothetical protein
MFAKLADGVGSSADRGASGVVFPFDRIHFEFEIESAA